MRILKGGLILYFLRTKILTVPTYDKSKSSTMSMSIHQWIEMDLNSILIAVNGAFVKKQRCFCGPFKACCRVFTGKVMEILLLVMMHPVYPKWILRWDAGFANNCNPCSLYRSELIWEKSNGPVATWGGEVFYYRKIQSGINHLDREREYQVLKLSTMGLCFANLTSIAAISLDWNTWSWLYQPNS